MEMWKASRNDVMPHVAGACGEGKCTEMSVYTQRRIECRVLKNSCDGEEPHVKLATVTAIMVFDVRSSGPVEDPRCAEPAKHPSAAATSVVHLSYLMVVSVHPLLSIR